MRRELHYLGGGLNYIQLHERNGCTGKMLVPTTYKETMEAGKVLVCQWLCRGCMCVDMYVGVHVYRYVVIRVTVQGGECVGV